MSARAPQMKNPAVLPAGSDFITLGVSVGTGMTTAAHWSVSHDQTSDISA